MSEYEIVYLLDGTRTVVVVEAASAAAAEDRVPIEAELVSVKFLRRVTRGCRVPAPRRL
ncbi:MAG: hypothetical protein HY943_08560 [Gammaproteobacteria bacterium]|nr:hypothetical protein [Gammaproteobacteria bacterium]